MGVIELFISLKDQKFQPFKVPKHLSTKSEIGNFNGFVVSNNFLRNPTSRGKFTPKTIKNSWKLQLETLNYEE